MAESFDVTVSGPASIPSSEFGSIRHQVDRMSRNVEVDLKQDFIREHLVEAKFKQIQVARERSQVIAKMVIEMLGSEHTDKMRKAALTRQQLYKQPDVLGYLTNGKLKLAKRELLVVLGATGQGKSTLAASLMATGFEIGNKLLYINNEQMAEDIYFKIAAATTSIPYQGIDRLSEQELDVLFRVIEEELCKVILVLDDDYAGPGSQTTTTVEGIRKCLEDLLKHNPFDLAVLDYYQQVETSIEQKELEGWKAQEALVIELSKFRNKSDMPFIVFAQVKHNDLRFPPKDRIEGRKLLLNKADIVLELLTDPKKSESCLLIHKCRSNGALVGQTFPLTFDGSRYHPAKSEAAK